MQPFLARRTPTSANLVWLTERGTCFGIRLHRGSRHEGRASLQSQDIHRDGIGSGRGVVVVVGGFDLLMAFLFLRQWRMAADPIGKAVTSLFGIGFLRESGSWRRQYPLFDSEAESSSANPVQSASTDQFSYRGRTINGSLSRDSSHRSIEFKFTQAKEIL